MDKEQDIYIEDGLSIPQMRTLLEVTNTMVKAINEEEFKAIMLIYGRVAERLLGKKM